MPLLTIEIDLSSLFDINIIVFTTLAFVFSVVVTIFLVLGLRPITTRARKANDLEPEKLSLTYLRLIMYVFAESIAFVADMFLVIFSGSYKVPWFTIVVFLTILVYKLVFVLLKDYRDLGFDTKGVTKSVSTAIKLIERKDIDVILDAIDEYDKEESKNKKMTKSSKTKRNNTPMILILLFILSCMGLAIYSQSYMIHNIEYQSEQYLGDKITDIKSSNKIVGSGFSINSQDTIILRYPNTDKKIILIPDK